MSLFSEKNQHVNVNVGDDPTNTPIPPLTIPADYGAAQRVADVRGLATITNVVLVEIMNVVAANNLGAYMYWIEHAPFDICQLAHTAARAGFSAEDLAALADALRGGQVRLIAHPYLHDGTQYRIEEVGGSRPRDWEFTAWRQERNG